MLSVWSRGRLRLLSASRKVLHFCRQHDKGRPCIGRIINQNSSEQELRDDRFDAVKRINETGWLGGSFSIGGQSRYSGAAPARHSW